MGIKFYDSNGKYWGEYDETRNLFIPSEEPITKTETQNSNLTFDTPQTERPSCETCRYYSEEEYSDKCDKCVIEVGKRSNYEPQTDCGWK